MESVTGFLAVILFTSHSGKSVLFILFARLDLKNIKLEGNIHIISVNNVAVNERNTNLT